MAKKKIKKDKKHELPHEELELIIIGEPPETPLTGLPETGEYGAWYLFSGEYWYYSSGSGEWVSGGGDRPTKPPVNP